MDALRYLVINADDFGLTAPVSAGILETLTRGMVSSTSAMVCVPGALEQLSANCAVLRGRAGLHLQLTGGEPRAARSRAFPARRSGLGALDPAGIELEWQAQYQAFLSTGLQPTHLDTHQHVHKDPIAFDVYCRMAAQLGLPARSCSPAMTRALRSAGVACASYFECGWSGSGESTPQLLARLDRIFAAAAAAGPVVVELMCHPGYDDGLLHGRDRERAVLTDPQLGDGLRARAIAVVSMSAIEEILCPTPASFR